MQEVSRLPGRIAPCPSPASARQAPGLGQRAGGPPELDQGVRTNTRCTMALGHARCDRRQSEQRQAPASAKTSVRTNARSKTVAKNQSARASTSNARQAPALGQRPKVRALGVRTNAGCPWMPERHVVERQDKSQMSVRMGARS